MSNLKVFVLLAGLTALFGIVGYVLTDPNKICPGQVLRIPPDA